MTQDTPTEIITVRHPDTAHNFGPASNRDSILFTAERPGGDPTLHPSDDGTESKLSIPSSAVKEWIAFVKDKGITDVLILLDDNELEIYDEPGLLELYKEGGLTAHRAPMGEPGACNTVKTVVQSVKQKDGKVVAHCTHGMGRSGRVAAGWLAMEYGLDAQEATDEAVEVAREKGMERMGAPHLLEKWLKG